MEQDGRWCKYIRLIDGWACIDAAGTRCDMYEVSLSMASVGFGSFPQLTDTIDDITVKLCEYFILEHVTNGC